MSPRNRPRRDSRHIDAGDILCSARASCLESSLRTIANLLGFELERPEVTVTGNLDRHGTTKVDRSVTVESQTMQ